MQATGMEKSLPHTAAEVNRVQHERQTKPWGAKPQQARTFEHVSSVWTCMATQNEPMSCQRKDLPKMWKAKSLRENVPLQTQSKATSAQPKGEHQTRYKRRRQVVATLAMMNICTQ